jgi:hypothetical protein
MSNTDIVLAAIRGSQGLTDSEIVQRTGVTPHQQVNQICRRLAREGRILREIGPNGQLVNRASPSALNGKTTDLDARPANRPQAPPPQAPSATRATLSELEQLDLNQTLLVVACSGSKHQGGKARADSGPSIVDRLPAAVAAQLQNARASVRQQVTFEERAGMPACDRYSGSFYQAAGLELHNALGRDLHILILSGGYGVLLAREPIGSYDAAFNPAWWAHNVIAETIAAYAEQNGLRNVLAFLAASTGYATALEGVRRAAGSAHLRRAF